jgi:hypothetical protein
MSDLRDPRQRYVNDKVWAIASALVVLVLSALLYEIRQHESQRTPVQSH